MSKVVLLRGHNANVWDTRPFEALADEHDVSVLVTGSNLHDLSGLGVRRVDVATPRDRLPAGRGAGAAAYALGERYLGLSEHLRGADIVHSAELGTWFSAQAASLKRKLGFKLVLTVWETLPWLGTYRWPRERRYREAVLPQVDLCLATTQRAADTLVLEGVPASKVEVVPPGIALDRFAGERPVGASAEHLLLSAGRLVWEKGHQDALRALAWLRRERTDVRLLVLGSGPEEGKLRAHAAELGLGPDAVEFRATVPYDEMPALHRSASALLLPSLPVKGWEEQFGMVLVEALAAGTPVVACDTGAIPEVLDGHGTLVPAGDWRGIARALLDGPLLKPTAAGILPPDLHRYSAAAASDRIRAAYAKVLA